MTDQDDAEAGAEWGRRRFYRHFFRKFSPTDPGKMATADELDRLAALYSARARRKHEADEALAARLEGRRLALGRRFGPKGASGA